MRKPILHLQVPIDDYNEILEMVRAKGMQPIKDDYHVVVTASIDSKELRLKVLSDKGIKRIRLSKTEQQRIKTALLIETSKQEPPVVMSSEG